jgi:GNAT superfamily N-acetyltransferase
MDSAISPVVTVRPATPADGPAILGLIRALAAYERLDPPDAAAQDRLLADAFAPHPRVQILLAQAGAEIIGYAFFFETYSTFLARPTLYLEDLFVLESWRGHGAGLALMRALAQEAIRRGCGRFEWVVLDWNTPAIGFYERLGAHRLADWLPYRLTGEALEALALGT